jgi:hypothetical protein
MKDSHLQFQAWAQEYGPIYSLILGTKVMIVLSSPEVVRGWMHLPNLLPSGLLTRSQSFSTADQQSTGTINRHSHHAHTNNPRATASTPTSAQLSPPKTARSSPCATAPAGEQPASSSTTSCASTWQKPTSPTKASNPSKCSSRSWTTRPPSSTA